MFTIKLFIGNEPKYEIPLFAGDLRVYLEAAFYAGAAWRHFHAGHEPSHEVGESYADMVMRLRQIDSCVTGKNKGGAT